MAKLKVTRGFLALIGNKNISLEQHLILRQEENKKFDTSNMFICIYDDNCVDLFITSDYEYVERLTHGDYMEKHTQRGTILKGLTSNRIAIFWKKHCERVLRAPIENQWASAGKSVKVKFTRYIVDCEISKISNFESVRNSMFSEFKIGPYEPGKATLEEIKEVLELAPEYFGLSQEQIDSKTKEKL